MELIKNVVNELPKHKIKRYTKRPLERIEYIVIHHSASKTWTAEQAAEYHVKGHGWPGIGYHYYIEKGEIKLCNYLDTRSYHVENTNTICVGICLAGDFTLEQPTDFQIFATQQLILMIRNVLGRHIPVKAHRDFKATACPGMSAEDFNKYFG